VLKKLSIACALAFVSSTPAGAAVLGMGDSICAGYCIPLVQERIPNAVQIQTEPGQPVTNLGSDGYQVNTVISREIPLVTANYYDEIVIIAGTNDMNNLFKAKVKNNGGYIPPMSNYTNAMYTLLQDTRMLAPKAIIAIVGVWDIAYLDNEDHYTAAQSAAFEAQIGQYDSAVQAIVAAQPGMFYVPRFPEATYPQYYTKANVCNDLHPTASGDALIVTQIVDGIKLDKAAYHLR
jgi:lysophospholipase L1-like esterase